MVTVVAQFTAKTTNPEKGTYFWSLIFCSINKLKSRTLFTCKNVLLSDFFVLGYGERRGAGADADTRINTHCHNQRKDSSKYIPFVTFFWKSLFAKISDNVFSYGHL